MQINNYKFKFLLFIVALSFSLNVYPKSFHFKFVHKSILNVSNQDTTEVIKKDTTSLLIDSTLNKKNILKGTSQVQNNINTNGTISDKSVNERLEKIYQHLEYNTISFNDLINKWTVTDPIYVREIFNRFVVKNALTINNKSLTRNELKNKMKEIYNGNVFIELKKRYYDDEIELLRFFTESKFANVENNKNQKKDFFLDPIEDYIFIKNVLGDKIYEDLKNKYYAHTDLTKDPYGNKEAYNFDLKFHLFNSEFMFWGITTKGKNKYLASIFEKWGDDQILLPGWYYQDVFVGLKIAYIDFLKNNEPYISYYLKLGTGFPIRQPSFEFKKDIYGPKLYHSGMNIYAEFGGHPLSLFSNKFNNIEVKVSTMFSITEYERNQFNLDYISQFYSNRNFLDLTFKYNEISDVLNLGWLYGKFGISNYSIVHYLYNPEVSTLTVINDESFKSRANLLYLGFGIENFNSLLKFDFSPGLIYDLTNGFGYVGFKSKFMLNSTFGFEFQFYNSIKASSLPFYRESSYITFSPIIRINY